MNFTNRPMHQLSPRPVSHVLSYVVFERIMRRAAPRLTKAADFASGELISVFGGLQIKPTSNGVFTVVLITTIVGDFMGVAKKSDRDPVNIPLGIKIATVRAFEALWHDAELDWQDHITRGRREPSPSV